MSVWSVFLSGITLQTPPKPDNMLFSKMKAIFLIRPHIRTDGADFCDKPELGLPVAAQQSSDLGASSVWRAG